MIIVDGQKDRFKISILGVNDCNTLESICRKGSRNSCSLIKQTDKSMLASYNASWQQMNLRYEFNQ